MKVMWRLRCSGSVYMPKEQVHPCPNKAVVLRRGAGYCHACAAVYDQLVREGKVPPVVRRG